MKQQLKAIFSVIIMTLSIQTTVNAATNIQDVQNFVARFYTEVLGRTAEQAGLDEWTNQLISGESAGSDVARGFIFSDEFMAKPEFSDDGAFVSILYRAFFNREADTDGLNGWLTQLANGTSKEDVLNGFLYSQEFTNLTESYGIKAVLDGANGNTGSTGGSVEDFVKRFYSVVFGREADAEGLASWVNKLNTKVATGADIAIGFVFSEEFNEASKDDVTFLNVLYSAFFNRVADEGGLNGWLSQLEQGTSRLDVLNGFLRSVEFVNLCDAYGILAYALPTNDLVTLFSGKTYYMNEDGVVATLVFGTNGELKFSGKNGNGEIAEIIFNYEIIGNTMHITGDGENSTLSNFRVVAKGVSYTTDNGDNRGFYFTYADAEADVNNDRNTNNVNDNTFVDNTLSASVSMSGNTLTVVFNKEMYSTAATSGQYDHSSTPPYWENTYTFVMVFDSYVPGGTITLQANGFRTLDNGTLAEDIVFTFPG